MDKNRKDKKMTSRQILIPEREWGVDFLKKKLLLHIQVISSIFYFERMNFLKNKWDVNSGFKRDISIENSRKVNDSFLPITIE